jgi:hypothetical protein
MLTIEYIGHSINCFMFSLDVIRYIIWMFYMILCLVWILLF